MTSKELKYNGLIANRIYFIKQIDLLGISKKYTGYYELVEIVNILINEISCKVVSFSRQVYPIVAQRFNAGVGTIERNIRNLIDKCWNEELLRKLNLAQDTAKPCCQMFIFLIKNYIQNNLIWINL